MMKKTLINLTVLAAVTLALPSCYKDLSTEATMTIPDIVVTGPDQTISIAYGQTLEISVEVSQEGRTEEDFTYLWEIDLVAGSSSDRLELGTDKTLSYQVANAPSDSPYTLSLTVTDGQTGLSEIASWLVYVSSSLDEGLLVAHTRDGGQTSDLDLLTNQYVTYGFSGQGAVYVRDLYSLANDEPIQGRVNALTAQVCSNGAVFNESTIALGTDEHLYRLDPLTYTITSQDAGLFNNTTESSFGTSALYNFAGYVSGAVVNNSLYGIVCNSDYLYSKININVTPNDFFYADNIAYAKMDQGTTAVFAEEAAKFYYIRGWQALAGAMTVYEPQGLSFSLEGAESMGAGCLAGSILAYVLKAADGTYHLVTLDFTSSTDSHTEYDLTGENMDQALGYAFCDNANVFYYFTESTIYTCQISGGSVYTLALTWKPDDEGEKITSMQQYMQGWYGTHQYGLSSYDFPLSTNRIQMIITTYNESTGEGKIYLRPFNVSTGRFTMTDNGSYGGFGEITAIATTLK